MLAQLNLSPLQNATGSKFTNQPISGVIAAILPIIFGASGLLLLIYIVIGGLEIMFSAGDQKAVAGGKSKITNGLLGFVVVFVAYWITQGVGILFNIQVIQTIFQ